MDVDDVVLVTRYFDRTAPRNIVNDDVLGTISVRLTTAFNTRQLAVRQVRRIVHHRQLRRAGRFTAAHRRSTAKAIVCIEEIVVRVQIVLKEKRHLCSL